MPKHLFSRDGGEFVANSVVTGDQYGPAAAKLVSGGFVMIWTDASGATDADGTGIIGQRFDANGQKVGGEFLVNTSTVGNQSAAVVAGLASGGFVVSWSDANSGYAEKAQIFDSAGAKVGSEFALNIDAFPHGPYHLEGLPAGGFVAINDDGAGQVFDAAGAKIGAAFTTSGGFGRADIAVLSGGGFVVGYDVFPPNGLNFQFFDANGAKVGSPVVIATLDTSHQNLGLTALSGGGFAAVWKGADVSYVHAQLFNAAGAATSAEILIGGDANWTISEPSVAALSAGDFVVTWTKSSSSGVVQSLVVAQVVDSTGAKVGPEFLVSTQTDNANQNHGQSTVLALDSGEFMVAWHGSGPGDTRTPGLPFPTTDGGIRAQIFTPVVTPTQDIQTSTTSVSETAVVNNGALVLSTASNAVNDQFTYSIVADPTGGAFRIEGDRLVVNDSSKLDFETAPTVNLTIRSTDLNGAFVDEVIQLTVTDSALERRYVAGDEVRVNDQLSWEQSGPAVQALASGGFVLTWTDGSFQADGTGSAIKAQVFDATGQALGGEFVVNTSTNAIQNEPAVTNLANGGFIISWTDNSSSLRAQIFDAAGVKVGGEITVSATTASGQFHSAITALAGGGFAVSWQASGGAGDGDGYGIRYQRFSESGAKLGSETLANTTTALDQTEQVMAGLANGRFVIIWTDRSASGGDTSGAAVRGQLFNSFGNKVGGEFLVNTATAGNQTAPSIAALAGGGFVVSWTDASHVGGDPSGNAVKAQLFAADGSKVGAEFLVNTITTGSQIDPSVTALADGGFAISWTDTALGVDRDGLVVRAQVFTSAGEKVGTSFEVNQVTGSDQFGSVLTGLASGTIATAWIDSSRSTQLDDIKLRLFTPTANAPITGTAGPDTLTGTADNDVIQGLNGGDHLLGLGGNDQLDGGAGADLLEGGSGNDVMHGGADNDILSELTGASDQLFGEGGDDRLLYRATTPGTLNAVLDGGDGDDYVEANTYSNVTVNGGAGHDHIVLIGSVSAFVDAGADADLVEIQPFGAGCQITLGAGADVVLLSEQFYFSGYIAIADFEVGDSGDALSFADILSIGWPIGTPFTNGQLQLSQQGADAVLRIDFDGPGPVDLGGTVIVFQNVQASSLTAHNLGGFAPNGSVSSGISVTGTAGADPLTGNSGDDLIIGGGGNDFLFGSAGNDSLVGGDGVDWLSGETGNDILNGGAGADLMAGGVGNDTFYVDNAGDVIDEYDTFGTNIVYASVGYTLTAGAHITLLTTESIAGTQAIDMTGNELDNTIWGNNGANTLSGGVGGHDTLVGFLGNDIYLINNTDEVVVENAGEGTDIVYVNSSYTLSANASIELLSTYSIAGTQAFDLTGNNLDNTIWGNRGNNTLSGGVGGHDTLVGFLGNDIYLINNTDEVIVENEGEGTDIVYVNSSYTLSKDASIELLSTYSIAGTQAYNMTGNNLDNTIWGNRGDNTLSGGIGGHDTLVGFLGNDTYLINNGDEVISELANEGTDIVYANVSYVLSAGASIELLSTNSIGGVNALDLTGNELVNTLWGNNGANVLNGGAGSDTLSGFGGADTFAFTTTLGASNVDAITDFVSGSDKIALDDAVFAGIGGLGALNANAFVNGTIATDADDRILYDAASGNLFFDADGNGAGAAVLFANLSNHAALSASDFHVI